MVSALAILCVRNESNHLQACLEDLLNDDIAVYLIDHSSTDDSVEIAHAYLGHGVQAIESMPWDGTFSLSEQMRTKARVADGATQDWLLHIDADERLASTTQNQSLLEAITEVDRLGGNCINFDEMVFLPPAGLSFDVPDYRSQMTHYYFFAPSETRLMRVFKRNEVHAWRDGGHRVLAKDLRLHPVNFVLRHYIALSSSALGKKYATRTFSDEDLARGWHRNRLNIKSYELPDISKYPFVRTLASPDSRIFDRSCPTNTHFWDWEDPTDG